MNSTDWGKGSEDMTKSEKMHELYELCKDINFNEANSMIINAPNDEERNFIRIITDYILQQKQKKVIAEKRF